MKITRISLTGADDKTDISQLQELSLEFPIIEWGILFSPTRAGSVRYPSAPFMEKLVQAQEESRMHLAAHLCGATMSGFIKDFSSNEPDGAWLEPHGLELSTFNRTFDRTQANFNARRAKFSKETIQNVVRMWPEVMDGVLITQHHGGNEDVWAWAQEVEQMCFGAIKAHQVLHDASGGLGKHAADWNRPFAGLLNGYAGGLGPDNVVETILNNEDVVGEGSIWIDMEGSLRGQHDEFDLGICRQVVERVLEAGEARGWFFS